jgi:tetratricopeptide (TPR) repeat protein
MSVCWFDYDNHGTDDLYIANMWTAAGERISAQEVFKRNSPPPVRALYQKHAMGNSLLRQTGSAFQDVTSASGVGMGRWAWSSDAWDFDHDGFPDLYVVNGMVSGPSRNDLNSFFWRQTVANSPDQAKPSRDYQLGWNAINELIRADGTWSGYERNVFYANNRDGSFSDISGAAGLDFVEDGRAFALADFDHDGRQEILLKNRNAPQLRLLKNVIIGLPSAIAFRLRGTKSNRDAIGTIITVSGNGREQTRSLQAGSGFVSQHSKEIFFGFGEGMGPVKASVHWPSGLSQEFGNLPLNHVIWLEEGFASTRQEPFSQSTRQVPGNTQDAVQSQPELLPDDVETWLLSPVSAPEFSLADLSGTTHTLSALRGKSVLLCFWSTISPKHRELLQSLERNYSSWSERGPHLLVINVDEPPDASALRKLVAELHVTFPVLLSSEDVSAIYNILYRYLFDRHRDLTLPTAFLVKSGGEIVKVYQGALNADHISRDLSQIPQTANDRLAFALPFAGLTAATEFPRNSLSYGSIYFQRGYYDEAAAWFQRALHDKPDSAEALYGLGSAYLQQNKTTEARENFERATKLQSAYPDTLPNAWNNLGLIAAREGQADQAAEFFQRALALSPDHLVALENLGNIYRKQRRWDDARTALERAVAVGPDDAEANYSLGMVYAQLNETNRAYDYLQRALKLRPDYPEALNNLGILYIRTSRRDQAVASFEECIRVAPDFDQAYLNLARVYAIENSPVKAREVLLQLLAKHPGNEEAMNMLRALGGN